VFIRGEALRGLPHRDHERLLPCRKAFQVNCFYRDRLLGSMQFPTVGLNRIRHGLQAQTEPETIVDLTDDLLGFLGLR
jgi:hypothetical protein